MNNAITAARETLGSFFTIVQSDQNIEDPALKVAVPNSEGGAEYIWMKKMSFIDADRLLATVDNHPVKVPGLLLESDS